MTRPRVATFADLRIGDVVKTNVLRGTVQFPAAFTVLELVPEPVVRVIYDNPSLNHGEMAWILLGFIPWSADLEATADVYGLSPTQPRQGLVLVARKTKRGARTTGEGLMFIACQTVANRYVEWTLQGG